MSENKIRVLDCTLRDGGHIVEGKFGKEVIKNVISKLVEAHTDIVEMGFLWQESTDEDTARFYTIEEVKSYLPPNLGVSKISLMADFIDLEHLEPCDGTVEIIRLSFKRHRLDWALKTAKDLIEKGYKVFINPVNCNVYTDEEYLEVIRKVNELHPYGFSIVDTFGVMRVRDLTHRYGIVENNLEKDVVIGLHLHENLGLAYSLAQQYIQMANPKRKIVIDGSLLGMGRVPGNLCIEQIMEHINYEFGDRYSLEPVYDAIDDYIAPIKKDIPWGYAIPYALSAKYNLHRTYAEFLINKWKLRTSDIERILPQVEQSEAELFNEEHVENLYRQYMSVPYDDEKAICEIKKQLEGKDIFLIAPGASIVESSEKISNYVREKNPIVIGIHCVPQSVKADYVFYSNIKRYEVMRSMQTDEKTIFSSNMTRYVNDEGDYIIDYSRMAFENEIFCDDSVIMMLNFLKQIGINTLAVAGFDGIINGYGNFYIDTLARANRETYFGDRIKGLLRSNYSEMNINFITESYYSNYKE